ncbi:glycoside hydrolase family 88/105 protein [Flexithrix dorotheae]|uniref:glycoside hydrolase family 88/105 protein n=1 Tax=Flexithrix dorotheae TaxID=70993 RepID=UPI00036A88A3|nr:glycoside hydrolase family 88 protein [Flexithrix dorotheae]
MKYISKTIHFTALASVLLLGACSSQQNEESQVISQETILDNMVLTNQYFMDKWQDVGKRIVTNRSRASNIWTRGVYYEGLMELHKLKADPAYYDYAVRWAEFHKWDLRDGETYTRNADNQCAGQTYIDLYLIDKDPVRIEKIKASMDSMMVTDKIDDWDWIDAIQMAMPVFARLGVVYNDTAYFQRMYEMYAYTKNNIGDNGLWNPEHGLWWRDADFDPPYTTTNGKDCYWSRGNGWVVAALVRVLELIPEDEPHRAEYEADLKAMLAALVPLQRKDGFWNVSLHDPEEYGGKETTGTSLFIYGMAWGINNGLISEEKYKPVIMKAWKAIVTESIHPNGFLGYVQGTGKEPKDGQPVTYDSMPDFEDYGLGCFLLAGSEMYKLIGENVVN